MAATPGEVMSQTRRKEPIVGLRLNPAEPAKTRRGGDRVRCALDSPREMKDTIPYSAKELKYLWAMWDEAGRLQQPGRRHRNIFAGAVGVTLTGWFMYGLGLSCCARLGSILMLTGAVIGAWHWLKLRRHQRHSAQEG
jgi:hypothetical protein